MDTKVRTTREDLLYPELSYKILGILFDVFKALGPGRKEHVYQNAVAQGLKTAKINFTEQSYSNVKYQDVIVGKYYFDFLIEGVIVLELKVRNYFSIKDIEQILNYLKTANLKLGILAHYTKDGVKYKRVVNIN